jgi:hypothetical protein
MKPAGRRIVIPQTARRQALLDKPLVFEDERRIRRISPDRGSKHKVPDMLRGSRLAVHAENLEATKIGAYSTKDGRITDALEVPDYAVRQRAVSDAWRVHGVPEERTAQEPNHGCVILKVDAATYARLERIRGAPFPPGTPIEIESEEPVDQGTAAPNSSRPTEEAPVVPVDKVGKSSGVPPWPPAEKVLTADEAVELARLRGEPEATISMFASMKPLGLAINGAIFKQMCQSGKWPPTSEGVAA